MIKLLGAFLLVAVTTWIGTSSAYKLKQRERSARDFASSLEQLAAMLSYNNGTLPETIRELSEGRTDLSAPFYHLCLLKLGQLDSVPFSRLWSEALEAAGIWLGPRERSTVDRVGQILGRYGLDAQLGAVMNSVSRLRQLADEAAVESRTKGKVYTALGICSGLMAVIVFI